MLHAARQHAYQPTCFWSSMWNKHFHGSELTYRGTSDCSTSVPFITFHFYLLYLYEHGQYSNVNAHVYSALHVQRAARICT
jgi:hypothetical protein